MVHPRYIPLVTKYATRRRVRSTLTVVGVATAMFVFYCVQAMQEGFRVATEETAAQTNLVVYRQDRYCPFTSHLPQDYERRISAVPGVKSVVPVKTVVSSCRTSLDVVTFRGVPDDAFDRGFFDVRILEGSVETWKQRSDAALIGERLARNRGLKVGDRLDVAGVTIWVAGILDSSQPQDRTVAYAHMDFLQRTAGNTAGIVTQFSVSVHDPEKLRSVAEAIDAEFRRSQEPTSTWSDRAFVARAVSDMTEIVRFAGWLGWGCLIGIFALVGNTIVLSVQDRIRDHAVLQTLGYDEGLIARLIMTEGMVLSLLGGLIGVSLGMAVARWGSYSLTVEGLSISVEAGTAATLVGLALSALLGVLASLVPAWQAARRETTACFRAV